MAAGIVGCAGLQPTVAAIKAGKDICLANKETLIAGGPYVLPLAAQHGVHILPADSEHSAIFQCIQVWPCASSTMPAHDICVVMSHTTHSRWSEVEAECPAGSA